MTSTPPSLARSDASSLNSSRVHDIRSSVSNETCQAPRETVWFCRIRTTAESHRRIAIIEVMGRDCGMIGLGTAYGQPDIILVPESPVVSTPTVRDSWRSPKTRTWWR